jgi:hypothetical protein
MRQGLLILVSAAAVSVFAQSVEAAPITIVDCYTGACGSLTGSITVDITDDTLNQNSGAGDVKIVINNLTNGFIDELGLKYGPGLSGSAAIEGFSASGAAKAPSLNLGECQNDNSGQSLNVCFDFASKNADRFSAGQSATFYLDSNSVDYLASLFTLYTGFAHVQGLPNEGSVKLIAIDDRTPDSVPEPASLLLLGSGVVAAAVARRRRSSGLRSR